MIKKAITSDKAPRAIGPYSQGIRIKGLLLLSGQIPVDPATGDVVSGDVGAQTRRVLTNLKTILEEAGGGINDIVKTTVFLKDLGAFNEMNATYEEFFAPPYPARATVGVNALPKGVGVEIDAIAVVSE